MSRDVFERYELPARWRWEKLGDICDIADRDHRTPTYEEDGVPLISPRDFTEDGIDLTSLKRVARYELDAFRKKCKPAKGDILYSRIGTVGEARLVDFDLEFVALHSIAMVKPKTPGLLSKYVLYLLKTPSVRNQAKHNIKSVGTPDLGLQRIRDFSVPVAPIDQQSSIVAEIEKQFSRLDEAVVNLKRVKANLKRYKAAVLTSATRGELLPGAGPFGSIPLAELCGDGLFVDGDWVESKDQDPAGDVRLVQLADVGDGEFRNKSARFLTREKAGALGCTFLKAGDLLVARMPDPLGRACIFPGDAKDCVTVVDVCIVRPDLERADRRWLMHCINAPQVRQQVASLEAGSTRKRISRKNLANVVVPAVPKPLQTQIAAEVDRRLSFVEAAEESVLENEAASFGLRHSILQRAFGQTG